MKRYTIRGFKYGDSDCPMARLQELEDKIEDGVLVEVVRCKDCIYFKESEVTNSHYCDWHRGYYEVYPNEYCFFGEKRKEQNDG